MKPFRFTIRKKLLLVSIAILSIPYIGLEYLREMERYLRDALEISLTEAAKTIAITLQGNETLFPDHPDKDTKTLYVHKLNTPIQVDGYTDDWRAYLDWSDIYRNSEGSLSYRLIVSDYGQYYYVLIQVQDDHIIYQTPASPDAIDNDHILLIIADPIGTISRYFFSPAAPGSIRPFKYREQLDEYNFNRKTIDYAANINGQFQPSDNGYNLEIAVPKNMVGDSLGFIVYDVDDSQNRNIVQSLGTAGAYTLRQPGRLLQPSARISGILEGLDYTDGRRVWVLDNQGQVLANNGNLDKSVSGSSVNFFYRLILPSINERFKDDLEGASRLRGKEVNQALAGKSESRWRVSPDGKAIIVSAATPVWINNALKGVVVVEETTNNIQMLQRQAMAMLFNKTLIVFSLVTALLLIFAARLSYRLRKLSKQVDASIDEHGRYVGSFIPANATDEIGDFSRNYASILERLKQYHDYLEGMAAKLSHELRTPIAVVQSSLEHLQSPDDKDTQEIYAERARDGINRLNLIVSRLSEAVRLEQSFQTAQKEPVDCRELLNNCIEGYRQVFPHQDIRLNLPDLPCVRNVAPDMIVQMMDKLVNNAVDFSSRGKPVEIKLAVTENTWVIHVINYGSTLPEQMSGQIFNSMVSVRTKKDGREPHLGLGLYLVRLIAEFHGGQVYAGNLVNEPGVEFIIQFNG